MRNPRYITAQFTGGSGAARTMMSLWCVKLHQFVQVCTHTHTQDMPSIVKLVFSYNLYFLIKSINILPRLFFFNQSTEQN